MDAGLRRHPLRGSVLLATALVVVLIYALMILSMANSHRTLAVTKESRARLQADALARGGLAYGLDQLRHTPGWDTAHTGEAAAEEVVVDPAAPHVKVWLQPTAKADLFELRASCQAVSTAASFQRVPRVDAVVYAATESPGGDPVISELRAGTWSNLPSPPDWYWTAPTTPKALPRFARQVVRLRADGNGNLYLLAGLASPVGSAREPDDLDGYSLMLFDRTAGAWKLLPPLPPTVFAANGSPVSGYDKRQITALTSDGTTMYAAAFYLDPSGEPPPTAR